jgi:citrate lyase subunit beta / citryl-CoA lyase
MTNLRIIWHMMPAGSERMIRKSVDLRPDAVIPCLEDGVAYDTRLKSEARQMVVRMSREVDWRSLNILYYPRINRTNSVYWRDDVATLFDGHIDGLVVGKEESPDRVRDLDEFMAEQEERTGRPIGSVGLILMIETALGLHRTFELVTACSRVEGALLGREDLQASLGVMRRVDDSLADGSLELAYARGRVVAECKAAGKEVIDGASFSYIDESYMLRDASLTARMGFTGKLSAHPNHVKFIRKGFGPDARDVQIASEMVERGDQMLAQGEAPVFGVAGMEVTPPIVEQARLVVKRAEWAADPVTA